MQKNAERGETSQEVNSYQKLVSVRFSVWVENLEKGAPEDVNIDNV